jgi:transketolase N-terminal domain/subunit
MEFKAATPGGSLGCTEFFAALFFKVMKHNPKFDMNAPNEDVFFLSNGHISPIYYSTLARAGYFEAKELGHFQKNKFQVTGTSCYPRTFARYSYRQRFAWPGNECGDRCLPFQKN